MGLLELADYMGQVTVDVVVRQQGQVVVKARLAVLEGQAEVLVEAEAEAVELMEAQVQ